MVLHGADLKTDSEYVDLLADTSPEELALEEKRLVRKIDLNLMPVIWIMYTIGYMDRTNIGNAKVAGLQKDLHLSSGQYSFALVVFFIAYVTFEVPSNLILARTRPSRYLPLLMVLWGITTACVSQVHTYGQLIALRFLVGVFEAGFAPGVLLIISSWYRKTEVSVRMAIYISGAVASGAFGGLIAGAVINDLDGARGIAGWRWLYIIEGTVSVAWAIISSFILLDFPATSRRLTDRERALAVNRLRADHVTSRTATITAVPPLRAVFDAFKSWHVWLLVLGYMSIVGASTLTYFYPTLVAGLGVKPSRVQYMTVPIYAVSFVCVITTGLVMDRFARYRGLVLACWMTVATIFSIVVLTDYNYTVRYVSLVFIASSLWAANGLALSFAAATLGPMALETRGAGLAVINGMGNLASIYGSYLFPSSDKPHYTMGFAVILAMCGFGGLIYAICQIFFNRYPVRSKFAHEEITKNPLDRKQDGIVETSNA